jgi:hypothetical protein
MNDFTIMLPVHRSNLALANDCIQNLLDTSDLPIICIDDFGNDNEYIKNNRLSFIHNTYSERQPLVKIWNQCIKECPTNNVIIASWRQRPSVDTFKTIYDKTNEGYGLITFDGLHFFCINKYLTTIIGFFDEGFTKGQFEDTDWFNRLRVNNIGIYIWEILLKIALLVACGWMAPQKIKNIIFLNGPKTQEITDSFNIKMRLTSAIEVYFIAYHQ